MAVNSDPRVPRWPELLRQHQRFEIIRELGRGGMGVVYEAIDRERELRVALKTLRNLEPASLFRFKQEFRALADATHPNLVTLYELIELGGQWLFTMELIDGVDYLSYLRGTERPTGEEVPTATSDLPVASTPGDFEETLPTRSTGLTPEPVDTVEYPPAEPARIFATLPQLAAALIALHDTGHLHRDIKPSNILVTDDGRVVLLDFGVITDLTRTRSRHEGFIGTPRYAAPEQSLAGATPSPASDWYSVGVILYEALTGQRLFPGSAQQILDAKQTLDPEPPSAINPEVDPVLDDLCLRLLERQPENRPHGAELLALLDQARDTRSRSVLPLGATDRIELIGREPQIDQLRAAFDEVRGGNGRSVLLAGRSGIGKTVLAQQFLSEVAADPHALVLSGRCYERESVPYQAIDTLVDSLCQFLLDLPRHKADALMPVDVQSLGRAFPVLNRVDAVVNAPARARLAVSDPQELRRRAFAALRELIVRIAERQPLVVFIDDLQWGDADSVPFVASMMLPPAPPLLFLATYRIEESEASSFLAALRAETTGGSTAPFTEITIDRLPEAEARTLAESLLSSVGSPTDFADGVARESGGNPFLVHEFVQFLGSRPELSDLARLDLAAMIAARTRALSPGARRLLELVAVAGKPVAQGVVQRAVGLGDITPRALAELRAARMVRTTGARAYDRVETYHDRIREVVVAALGETELRGHHLRLARGIAASEHPDPESLATHYAEAGERATALRYAIAAADAAADALAFERAATMYRLALHLTPDDAAERGPLGRKLGDALVYAGRGIDAARAYAEAALHSDRRDALDLQVRAGSELLRNGRVDEGIEALRPALAGAGIMLARSPLKLLLSVVMRRTQLRLRWRGLGYRPTPVEEIAPRDLTRIDAFGAASGALGMADILRGADIQTRHLLAALRAGDPRRVGRALVYEAAYSAVGGPASLRRTRRILDALHTIAEETGEPLLEALHHGMSALTAYQCGEWRSCRTLAEKAEEILRDQCQGVAWELTSVQLYRVWALCWRGDFNGLAEHTRRFVREARERGDLYAEVSLSTGLPSFPGLANDAPDATRSRIEEAFARWSRSGYHLQHYWAELGFVNCDLYAGDAAGAYRRILDNWSMLRRNFMLGISMVNAEICNLRARAALELAASEQASIGQARREIRRFARLPLSWCRPATELVRAGLARLQGDTEQAARRLRVAEDGFRQHEMLAHAATARRWRGVVMGGERGSGLLDTGDAELVALGVRNPERMSRFLAPGFVGSSSPLLTAGN